MRRLKKVNAILSTACLLLSGCTMYHGQLLPSWEAQRLQEEDRQLALSEQHRFFQAWWDSASQAERAAYMTQQQPARPYGCFRLPGAPFTVCN